jgi:hypothetical protein
MRRSAIASGTILVTVPTLLSSVSSCSDRALARPQAAASLRWDISTSGTKHPLCVPGPHWSNAPVAIDDQQYVSAGSATAMVVDGVGGGSVTCRVAARGDGYLVTGEVRSEGVDPQGNPLLTRLAVSFTIGANQAGAQGTLYITDQKSADFAFSSDTGIVPPKPGCTFSVYSQGDMLGVAPGRVWADVQCPHISDWRNRDKQECQITDGFVVFQNCLED